MCVSMYINTNSHTHTQKKARYGGLKSKAKPMLVLMTSTVNSVEISSEISVILRKCIFIHLAYSDYYQQTV